jgi:tagatose 6-phosphate kinase
MMTESEWQSLRQAVVATCSGSDARWLTISGSLPPSIKPMLLRQLIDAVPTTCAVALDTSGAPLELCLDANVGLLKVNAEELAQATGTTIETYAEAVAVARQVCARGPKIVAVTLGAHGAIAVTPTEAWHVAAPAIRAISPVGSGDCTLAGMIVALHRGDSLDMALRLGVACGSANALQPYAAVFDRTTAEQFFAELGAVAL